MVGSHTEEKPISNLNQEMQEEQDNNEIRVRNLETYEKEEEPEDEEVKTKLNNSVRKIKETVLDKNLNFIKLYLPETPNLIINFQEVDVPDRVVEIADFTTSDLEKRFQEITYQNTTEEQESNLVIKRYNIKDNKIETSNSEEYNIIKKFLEDGEFENLESNIDSLEPSNLGMLIMEGYRRFLKTDNYHTLNFHLLFKHCFQNKNSWFYTDEIHQNLQVCYQELENQYLDSIDERYSYMGCLILYLVKSKKQLRIPIYLDKNSQLAFPSMRKISKHFFTMYNISNEKDIYLDLELDSEECYLIIDEGQNMVRYSLTQKGICFHQDFPDYLNHEYIEEVKEAENKFTSIMENK